MSYSIDSSAALPAAPAPAAAAAWRATRLSGGRFSACC